MMVLVPRGLKAGQMMDINVAGRVRVRVAIPRLQGGATSQIPALPPLMIRSKRVMWGFVCVCF
jgi:hypothetical protein